MKTLGNRSLASLLEAVLHLGWGLAWFCVLAFTVFPFLRLENSVFGFPVTIRDGLVSEAEGPGGTWTVETMEASISTPRGGPWFGSLAVVPFFVLIAVVLGELRAIFRSLQEGSPFVAKNARRLRRVGLALLLYEGLHVVVTLFIVGPTLAALRPLAGNARIRASAWPDLGVLFVAFAVLVLAEVFRRGAQMQDEQEHTV